MQEDQPNPNPKTTTPESEKTQNEVEGQLQCPRCGSKNTKFGYYNNYKLTQPRHYCKNCHRHWTKGGTLRNVPIGGGSRRISGKRATSKKVISKPPTSPAISASMMELPLTNSVPVPVQSEMPLVPVFCDYQGYAGNFNVGWPYMRSSSESGSNGGNERFNGDLNMFFRDLW